MKNRRWSRCKAILCTSVLVWIFLTGAEISSWASPVSRAEQEKTAAAARQEQAEARKRELEQQKKAAEDKIKGLGAELQSLLTETKILQSDIKEMESRISEAKREYERADKSRQKQYDILKKRIRYIYEEGNITYLDILLKAKNVGDVIDQTEYFRQLYEYDRRLIFDYDKLRKEASDKKTSLEEHKSELETMNQEYGIRQENLGRMIEDRKVEAETFGVQLKAAEIEAAEAAEAVRLKTEEIRALRAAEEQARRRAEQDSPAAQGIPKEKTKSTGGTEFGRNVADYALQFVGNPYVWGGTSLTNGADCSGFTQSVYKHFGVSIPRTSGEQAHFGKEISYKDMEPGDLVCYVGHVAMYIGDGRIVHASSKKSGIKVGDNPAYRTIVSIRRPWQ